MEETLDVWSFHMPVSYSSSELVPLKIGTQSDDNLPLLSTSDRFKISPASSYDDSSPLLCDAFNVPNNTAGVPPTEYIESDIILSRSTFFSPKTGSTEQVACRKITEFDSLYNETVFSTAHQNPGAIASKINDSLLREAPLNVIVDEYDASSTCTFFSTSVSNFSNNNAFSPPLVFGIDQNILSNTSPNFISNAHHCGTLLFSEASTTNCLESQGLYKELGNESSKSSFQSQCVNENNLMHTLMPLKAENDTESVHRRFMHTSRKSPHHSRNDSENTNNRGDEYKYYNSICKSHEENGDETVVSSTSAIAFISPEVNSNDFVIFDDDESCSATSSESLGSNSATCHNEIMQKKLAPPTKIRSKMHDLANTRGSGVIQLSSEEKRTLLQEGYHLPTRLPLTHDEEEALKIVRRKIKNKLSAQESRRKRKEYIDELEKKVHMLHGENSQLRGQITRLDTFNRDLITRLHAFQSQIKA